MPMDDENQITNQWFHKRYSTAQPDTQNLHADRMHTRDRFKGIGVSKIRVCMAPMDERLNYEILFRSTKTWNPEVF